MDLSELLAGFVKIDTWISQSCYRHLSKLIHGPHGGLWPSAGLLLRLYEKIRKNTKENITEFVTKSKHSMPWVRCAFGNIFKENCKIDQDQEFSKY